MTIIDKEVLITIGNNSKYYEEKGYIIPRYIDEKGINRAKAGVTIWVKVEDLPKGSPVKIKYVCDYCNGESQIEEKDKYKPYYKLLEGRKIINKDCCGNKFCQARKRVETRNEKPINKGESLGEKFPNLINEWSNKNNKTPFDYTIGTDKVVWWNCHDCGSEYDMQIAMRTSMNCACPYCAGKRVNETNSLWVISPDIAKLLKNPQRGHELTAHSNKKEIFICPDCNQETELKSISMVVKQGLSCECGDGISYPEKFVFNMLTQLNVKFKREKIFKWSKNVKHENKKLKGKKRYDFYIPSINLIIETHGQQHYTKTFEHIGGRKLVEEQENDKFKEKLAIDNGIDNYIILDCSTSELNFIKTSIVNSKLNKLFNLNKVNWEECHSFAISSIVKKACDLWCKHKNIEDVANEIRVDKATVRKYLVQGSKIGLCDYEPKEEGDKTRKNNLKKINKINSVKVVQLTIEGKFIREWDRIADAQRYYNIMNIIPTCRGKQKASGGFRWMYSDDYEKQKDNIKPIKVRAEVKPVVQLTLNNEFIKEWNNAFEVRKELGIVSVLQVCRNELKTSGGFKWMYKEDYEKLINNEQKEECLI